MPAAYTECSHKKGAEFPDVITAIKCFEKLCIHDATLHFTHVKDDLLTSLRGKCGEKIINSLQKYNLKSIICHIYSHFDAKAQKVSKTRNSFSFFYVVNENNSKFSKKIAFLQFLLPPNASFYGKIMIIAIKKTIFEPYFNNIERHG